MRIAPHLWFDNQPVEAAKFYCSLFPRSSIRYTATLRDTPSGDGEVVAFDLASQPFLAISAGPYFSFDPSISFIVNFDPPRDERARKRIQELWEGLADDGEVFIPIGQTPFSERYGWVKDRYGLSWQLILADPAGEPRPTIVPCLMFAGQVFGKAAEAGEFYRSVFPDSRLGQMVLYQDDAGPEAAGTVMYSDFRIGETWFAAMDSFGDHGFRFNEAISFVVPCRSQEEIDYYWSRLSADPEAEECGWCKDQFGISWQVQAASIYDVLASGNEEAIYRATQALLRMKKVDLDALEAAYK